MTRPDPERWPRGQLARAAAAGATVFALAMTAPDARAQPVSEPSPDAPAAAERSEREPARPEGPPEPAVPAGGLSPLRELQGELPRPSILSDETLARVAERVGPAVFEVRTTTDLGRHFRPRYAEGTGAATLVRLAPEAEPVLVTSYAHVAQAVSVEVRLGETWTAAAVTYGSPMFDLAVLQPDAESGAPLDPAAALPLATRWSPGSTVYCPAGAGSDGTPPGVVIGALGDPPANEMAYYVRGLFTQHNGYPIVAYDGSVLAIASLVANDDGAGVLAIPFGHVATWHAEWPQLDTNSPIGWEPRVQTRSLELRTGDDALNR